MAIQNEDAIMDIPRFCHSHDVLGQGRCLFDKRCMVSPTRQGFESITAQTGANIQNAQSRPGIILSYAILVKSMDQNIKSTLA
jgi:hypothetical protein